MASGDTENKLPVSSCCNAWIEKCSKLEKGRNYLRQSVNLLTESFDKIQTENKSLSAELGKKREESETLTAANASMEKQISSMKSEISLLKQEGANSGSLNNEDVSHLRSSISENEKKIKELTKLVKTEKEKAIMEMKKAETAKKRADQALKQLSVEKVKVDQAEKQPVEQYAFKIEELTTKLNEAKTNTSVQTAELHETKISLEAKERKLSEQKKLLDLTKKNEGKLKKHLEETKKIAQDEKSRADNLQVQVKHCMERIQLLQKQVEESKAAAFLNVEKLNARSSKEFSLSKNSTEVKYNSKKRRLMEECIEDNKKRIVEMEKTIQQLVSTKTEESGKALQRNDNKHLKEKVKHWKNQYKQAKKLAILEKKQNNVLYNEFICLKVKVLDIFGHMDVMGKLFSNKTENLPKKMMKIAHEPYVKNSLRDTESISGIDSAKQIFHTSCSSDPEEQIFSFGNFMSMLDLDDPSEEQRYREAIDRPLSPSLPDVIFSVDIFGGTDNITHFLIASRTLISDWSALTQLRPLFTQLLISLKNAPFSTKDKVSFLFSILVHNFSRSPSNNASIVLLFKKIQSELCDDGTKNILWGIFSLHEFLSSIGELLIEEKIREYSFSVHDTVTSKLPTKEQLLTGSAVLAAFHASTNSAQYARAFCFNVLLSRLCDDSAVAVLHIFFELCTEMFLHYNPLELMVLKSLISFSEGKYPCDYIRSKDCPFASGSLPVETVVSKLLECSASDDMCDVFSLLEVVAVRMGWVWTCHLLIPKMIQAVKCSGSVGFVVGSLALFGQLGRIGVESEGRDGEHVGDLKTVLWDFLRRPSAKSSFLIQLTAVSSVLEITPGDADLACQSFEVVRDWFFALSHDQQVVALKLVESLPHFNAKILCKRDDISW